MRKWGLINISSDYCCISIWSFLKSTDLFMDKDNPKLATGSLNELLRVIIYLVVKFVVNIIDIKLTFNFCTSILIQIVHRIFNLAWNLEIFCDFLQNLIQYSPQLRLFSNKSVDQLKNTSSMIPEWRIYTWFQWFPLFSTFFTHYQHVCQIH